MTTLAPVKYYARNPTTALRRVGSKLYELTHPDEPWMAQGAIHFCEASLTPEMAGFQWGGGTARFAQRLGSLTSIEHESGWFKVVQRHSPPCNTQHFGWHLCLTSETDEAGR
jgi:hypothetical protein